MALLKHEIKSLLEQKDFDAVVALAKENRKIFSVLISLGYDKEDVLCWRAIEALGMAAGAAAQRDPEVVRNVVQRLLWSIREESGGIGWSAPEMLGEVVVYNPRLCSDIPQIILSFHEEEVFLVGILWAMGRIAETGGGVVSGAADLAQACLGHRDPAVRGYALHALQCLKVSNLSERACEMLNDTGRFMIYENHELVEKSVADLALAVLSVAG